VTLKVQMEFRMQADGWSEHIYHAGDAPKAFAPTAQLLCDARVKCLVSAATIHHCRISLVGGGARSYRFPVQGGNGFRSERRDVGAVTVTCGLYTAGGGYRTYKLHGCPDDDTRFLPNNNPATVLDTDRETYFAYLIAQQYQIRHVALSASDANLMTVKDVSVAGPVVTFVIKGVLPDTTKKVIISGMKGYGVRQFNGVWTIATYAATATETTITAGTTRTLDTRIQYVSNTGKVRIMGATTYAHQNITEADDFEGFSTRKTGRPTDEHRGRASSRR
jgi:hypothetical protein